MKLVNWVYTSVKRNLCGPFSDSNKYFDQSSHDGRDLHFYKGIICELDNYVISSGNAISVF